MHKIRKIFLLLFFLGIAHLCAAATHHKGVIQKHAIHHHAKNIHHSLHKKTIHATSHKISKSKTTTHHAKKNTKYISSPIKHRTTAYAETSKTNALSPENSAALNLQSTTDYAPSKNLYRVLTQPIPTSATHTTPSESDSALGDSTTHETTPMAPPEEHSFFSHTRSSRFASMEQRLVDFVHKSVSNLRYSTYKLGGTHIDTNQGIYIVDCSGYVDHTLRAVYPKAYFSMVDTIGVNKPNSLNYYNFFTNLSSDESNQYWSKVEDIEKLRPGDILVFRYKNMRGRSTGGHVMVVMDKPTREDDTYYVSVADSAASRHSEDTRQRHVSGVGIGTLLLRVNPKTGRPSAYAWTMNSQWKNNVSFAMARPHAMTS